MYNVEASSWQFRIERCIDNLQSEYLLRIDLFFNLVFLIHFICRVRLPLLLLICFLLHTCALLLASVFKFTCFSFIFSIRTVRLIYFPLKFPFLFLSSPELAHYLPTFFTLAFNFLAISFRGNFLRLIFRYFSLKQSKISNFQNNKTPKMSFYYYSSKLTQKNRLSFPNFRRIF